MTTALQARLAALSPEQRALLERELAARGRLLPEAPADEPLPLTPAQQQLWVVQQLQPDSSAYHIAFSWTIDGALDADALGAALQALVDRHGALRATFQAGPDGLPQQRVLARVACLLLRADLRGQPTATEADALDTHLRTLARKPFDLAEAPLLRAHLLQCADDRHVLVWVLHHLVADGWSRGVLLRELSALYAAAAVGQPLRLPPLPTRYADHLLSQDQWLASPAATEQGAWWRHQLAGLAPLALPTDRPHTPEAGWHSRTVQRWLPGLTPRIAAAASACGATPFMLLLTVFKLMLYRWTGRRDLAVGVPVAGRSGPETAGLIGFFVNTLVVRSQGPEGGRVADWVDAVKRSVADAFDHAELPLARVIDAVGAPREPGRAPLVELMFQYQGAGYGAQNTAAPRLGALALAQAPIDLAHTKFDLTWHAIERDGGLLLAVEYRSALFDEERIGRFIDHFARLLDGVLADPTQPLGRVPMLSADELGRIGGWQFGPRREPASSWRSFIDRFEAQAARAPEAIAVDVPGGKADALTYRALDEAADALAAELRARGVGPESIVGVCLPRVPVLMVAMLAVWKAGGAWLALDPVLPAERLRYMVRDSGAALVLALPADIERLAAPGHSQGEQAAWLPLPLAEGRGAGAARSPQAGRKVLSPTQLAYVLYTSGSTGRPKGTLLPHGGLMHYLDWCLERYPLHEGRGAPVNSSIGFDATITGLFAPLLVGGTVTLLPEADPLAALADTMAAGHSLVKLTPAHMNALAPLMEARPAPDAASLPKAFVIGGESLTEVHVNTWRERFPGIALLNEYGPTETVVGCCVHEVQPEDRGAMPIGRPITGAAMYLLDAELNPVPAGAVGEVCIGGAGMARGYLGRPALTAERFLPDPFDGAPGATLYRTGDLAMWRADGSIAYLGRADQQLKLRGHRIEAGEVESALVRQPGIAEAVVDVLTVGTVPALVAWVRRDAASTAALDIPALRQSLAAWLPTYMVPSHVLVLDTMPLTPNGKVDRAALPVPQPAPAATAPGAARGADAAGEGGTAFATLHGIWCQVLRREAIGPDDNFFDLGGDSVAAMQIVARAHQAGLVLTPAAVFTHQTLASQALAARPAGVEAPEAPVADGEAAVLAPAQWAFFDRVDRGEIAVPAHWNQSLLLDLAPSVDPSRLRAALQALPARHAALRLRFEPADGGGWRAWHAAAADTPVPLEVVDLAPDALPHALAEAQRTLRLAEGPLLRAWLYRLADGGGHRLLLVMHHLVVDGLSWRLLLADLAQALAADAPAGDAPAPAFARWTAALQAQRGRFEREAAHWAAAAEPGTPLPRAAGAPAAARESEAAERRVVMDPDDTRRLAGAALALGRRPDTLLLAALAQTLQQWTRGSALVIDVERHGRGLDGLAIEAGGEAAAPADAAQAQAAAALARTVGWFTAQWPLRLALPAGAPQRQLDAVAEALAEVPQNGLGFGVLRQHGRVPASPAEVSFNHLGAADAGGLGPLQGLAPEPVPAQRDPAALRSHLLEVVTLQRDGRLVWLWRHDGRLAPATVDALARRTAAHLQSLLALAPA
ncbi:amino acid adenylation domain-containing protein [Aquincola sp. MAHUQ-54]|uniref:Amino acid adenylation domain-containing protein n=1 Tax=Aquincola agrisoli TaxID=3119538 RepID=A0AAW9QAL9_9BURK